LGALPQSGGTTEFRVWAPNAERVSVRVGGEEHPLEPEGDGLAAARLDAPAGADYVYVADGREYADPCSRCQPEGLRGPSRVVALDFEVAPGPELSLDELVIYELHVGTFSAEGTFDGVVPYLRELRELGITAIELMPVATFPGNRNWGYDGVFAYAPHRVYGGPEGLARLVDAAHGEGLGVILDVVYNHLGPGAEFTALGPWFTDRHETPWGDALDFSQQPVREWAIENALMWTRDYGVDGLRLDAVFAVHDESEPHVLRELAERVHEAKPGALVIAEEEVGVEEPIREWGHDAQWADELHHELHVLLSGETFGYYEGYGSVSGLARQLERKPAERLVVCSQNHDQVGNRAFGDRPEAHELEPRARTLLFAPQTPLIFMGQEYGERAPFRFFTDHDDPEIAEATRQGRKKEFDLREIPDPQALETFEASKLTRDEVPGIRELYRDLLALRRELPREIETEPNDEARTLRARRGSHVLEVDFDSKQASIR
jgi:maltooligosyltrehalose trehalohydrolase